MTPLSEISCEYYERLQCRSCSLLSTPLQEGIERKFNEAQKQIFPFLSSERIFEPIFSPKSPFHSRAKAKMVVSGTVETPLLGLLNDSLDGVDLTECPLHFTVINTILTELSSLITRHRLFPYTVSKQSGELKAVIISCNRSEEEAMLRFVLRSRDLEKRVRACAADIQRSVPQIKVVSINIQPLHAAILEGSEEIQITEERYIWESYGGVNVAFPPQAFMQVTPEIAEELYKTAREWLEAGEVKTFLDLFCGAGGFSLFAASIAKKGYGIEISPSAVEAARTSSLRNGFTNLEYRTSTSEALEPEAFSPPIDTLIVNPPRRGLGVDLISKIFIMNPARILYSSCSVTTWVKDMEILSRRYAVVKVKPFDMFPLTDHLEILSLLVRI